VFARLRVHQRQVADRGQRALTRVANLDCHDGVALAQRAERPRPVVLVAEIRDHGHEPGLPRHLAHAYQRVAQRAVVVVAVGSHALREGAAHGHQATARCARPHEYGLARPEAHERHASGAPDRQPCEHLCGTLGHVALQPVGGAERHRRRHVQRDPGGQRPLRNLEADVGDARAGGRRGIDLAHVVADLVGTELSQLGAHAEPRRAAVARQRARGTASHDQIELVDQALGHAPRSLAPRGRAQKRVRHAATVRRKLSTGGSLTAPITFSSRSSALTFSARAS
jgi:hypothetical protein